MRWSLQRYFAIIGVKFIGSTQVLFGTDAIARFHDGIFHKQQFFE